MTYTTKDITIPVDRATVYRNNYWYCLNGDPKQALFFGSSPQCNRNYRVMEWGLQRMKENLPEGVEVAYVDLAFVI